jgi:starch-binding outer membrane protein SusE/F
MKKLVLIFTVIISLGLLFGCEKDFKDAVLDITQSTAPVISNPSDGASFVLFQGQASEPLTSIEWSAAQYNLDDIPNPRYVVHVDVAGNNFAQRRELAAATSTSVNITHAQLNSRLLDMELEPGVPHDIQLRVFASISANATYDNLYSAPITLTVTPYSGEIEVKPIYMLGDGTEAGWNNNNAIEMYHIEEGKFALVANLRQAGTMVKFISVLGQWAPQWGAEPGGTATEGQLAYRPTEDVPDPAPIDIASLDPGYYRVVADTANLTYTITPSTETLYLLGSATAAGWDNTAALEMTQDAPGMFSIVTNLTAGQDMYIKFIEVLGQWAPQYGTDDEGTWEGGRLIYRPTEDVPDPANIPAPDESGSYLIEVNLSARTYSVTPQ